MLNNASALHLQGRYADALKVLDGVWQQDASVAQVSLQKGRPVPVTSHFMNNNYQCAVAFPNCTYLPPGGMLSA